METNADYNVNLSLLGLAIVRRGQRLKLANQILDTGDINKLEQYRQEVQELKKETLLELPEVKQLNHLEGLIDSQIELIQLLTERGDK